MTRLILAAALALLTSAASAEPIRDDRYFVAWGQSSARDVVRAVRCPAPVGCRKAQRHRRHHARRAAIARIPIPKPQPKSLIRAFAAEVAKALPKGNRLTGVVPALAAKAQAIVHDCGARVISGVRHTYVAGTRRISLHASGKAVDLAGNPRCIYAHLRSWPGGVSVDYARVGHVHVSYDPQGGREMGARFAHGGGRSLSARKRHHHHRHRRSHP